VNSFLPKLFTTLVAAQSISAVRLRSAVTLTPPYSYSNQEIAAALNLPALPRVCRKIGIQTRGAFLPLDLSEGRVRAEHDACELDMAENVAVRAIQEAGISSKEITLFCFISCTAQHGRRIHFELSSHILLHRLGLNRAVHRFELDAGCDGFVQFLHTVNDLIKLRKGEHALIVTTSLPSLYFDRERTAHLSHEGQFANYVFGDGAAAIVLSSNESEKGAILLDTWTGCDPAVDIAWTGITCPENSQHAAEISYNVEYRLVDKSYVPFLVAAVRGLMDRNPGLDLEDVDRFYFHQANGVLPQRAAQQLNIPLTKLALNADRRGNTGAASIPIMLAEDHSNGVIAKGARVMLASVGAGLDYSSAILQY
jgi:3-oxoacyl-[acyl-carrier-protein] synthase III